VLEHSLIDRHKGEPEVLFGPGGADLPGQLAILRLVAERDVGVGDVLL